MNKIMVGAIVIGASTPTERITDGTPDLVMTLQVEVLGAGRDMGAVELQKLVAGPVNDAIETAFAEAAQND